MRTAVIALTENGARLAVQLGNRTGGDVYVKYPTAYLSGGPEERKVKYIHGDFTGFVGALFNEYRALVFIMACGIVVRAIAPYMKDKCSDPAVVVLDEAGRYCISLLSGHLGGANKLAAEIAGMTGGIPVITTATDVNGVVAFDVLAAENDCSIENLEALKYISSRLVNGGKIGLCSDIPLVGNMPGNIILKGDREFEGMEHLVVIGNKTDVPVAGKTILYLRPKNLLLGIGCRRGTAKEQIEAAVNDFFLKNGKSMLSLKAIATVDLKKDEHGLLEYCRDRKLRLEIIDRDSIKAVEDEYTASSFVKDTTGVSSIAEPCAVLAGRNAKLLCKKTLYKGITLALAEEEKVFNL